MPLRPVPRILSASAQQPRPRRRRRGLRAVAVAALGVAAILLASTAVNLALEQSEKSATVAYGEQIHINAGAINVVRSGNAGPTIVMLSGLGTAAPALDFAPLIRELGGFRTVVVEGFGYGYSDMSARPRTPSRTTKPPRAGPPAPPASQIQLRQPLPTTSGHAFLQPRAWSAGPRLWGTGNPRATATPQPNASRCVR